MREDDARDLGWKLQQLLRPPTSSGRRSSSRIPIQSELVSAKSSNDDLESPTPTPPTTTTRPTAAEELDELANILPSYQMYQSTISKNLTPTTEDLRTDPPGYDFLPKPNANHYSRSIDLQENELSLSPINSQATGELYPASSSSASATASASATPTAPVDPFGMPPLLYLEASAADTADESTASRWEDSILANAHKLKRLTSINKELSKSLKIQIVLTEKVGKVGVVPTIIDPQQLELKQNDNVFGYVLVTNTTSEDVPFDAFPVVLEGCMTIDQESNSILAQPVAKVVKFLTMFDFNASWTDANLVRFQSEKVNPYVATVQVDPVDGTYTYLNERRVFKPNITYKKFFSFKLPEKLLEVTCETHGLVKHLQIPPTLGVSRNEIVNSLRHKWKTSNEIVSPSNGLSPVTSNLLVSSFTFTSMNSVGGGGSGDKSAFTDIYNVSKRRLKYASGALDFAFPDASISYSISARIIGKASDYEHLLVSHALPHLTPNADEYVVANEDYCYFRVLPITNEIFELNRFMIDEEAKLIFDNLVRNVKDKINQGYDLLSSTRESRGMTREPRGMTRESRGTSRGRSSIRSTSASLSRDTSRTRDDSQVRSSSIGPTSLRPTASAVELNKMQQSYMSKVRPSASSTSSSSQPSRDTLYEVFVPYRKKTMFSSKIMGLTAISIPRRFYNAPYLPLQKFASLSNNLVDPTITIPMDLTFIFTETPSTTPLPEIKKISAELVSLTVKSKSPIPVVIYPDLVFNNKTGEDFNHLTIRPFQKYANDLNKLLKELGGEAMDLDKEMSDDVLSIASMVTKYDYLKVNKLKVETLDGKEGSISGIPWKPELLAESTNNKERQYKYTKKLHLVIDMHNLEGTTAATGAGTQSEFTLVPDFQSCNIARLYYLKLIVKFTNGEKGVIRVPVVLQKN